MTSVIIMGDLPSTRILGDTAAERVDTGPGPAGSAGPESFFLDLVADRLRTANAVLAIYPAWRAESNGRLVRLARSVLSTDRVAGIALCLPPLALSVVADMLTFLAPYVSPGMLSSLAYRLQGELSAGAWVSSVAKLEHIETPFKAHVASYLPGGFLVTAVPRPGVYRVAAHRQLDFGRRPADPVLLLLANGGGDLQWVRDNLAPALRPSGVTDAEPQPLGSDFWGTQKYVEFLAFSGHPQALWALAQSMVCRPCPWCGELTDLSSCAFCGMTQPAAPAPGGGSMPPHQVRAGQDGRLQEQPPRHSPVAASRVERSE